jgi:hypothetical protein
MRTATRTIAALAIALFASAGAFAQPAPPQGVASLFPPAASAQTTKRFDTTAPTPGTTPGLVRSRDIAPDLQLLLRIADELQRAPGATARVEIPVFPDVSFVATIARVERAKSGAVNLYGTLDGVDYGTAVLTLSHGGLAGTLQAGERAYRIRYFGKAGYEVQEIDKSRIEGGADDIRHVAPESRPKAQAVVPLRDDGSTIDVLVVYTPAARIAAANKAGADTSDPAPILSEIDAAIAAANNAYFNSGVNQRLNLVHAQEVTYTESGDLGVDLARLSDMHDNGDGTFSALPLGSDGFLDNVPALRDTWGADAVSLWVNGSPVGVVGIGWFMNSVGSGFERFAYNVVVWSTASSNQTFAHELGHNMGLNHDSFVSPGSQPFAWAHGYVDTTRRFRTIMAYNDQCASLSFNCTRIDYFSTPLKTTPDFSNAVVGNASNADSHRVLNDTALTVANFRASVAQPGDLQLQLSSASAVENDGSITLQVQRVGGALGTVTVDYATSAGTAVPGTDYVDTTGTLTWLDGDASPKPIAVTLLDDAVFDGARTFTVTLSNATGGAALGTPSSTNVTIDDDESGVSFAQAAYTLIEGGPAVNVQVQRMGSLANAIGVTWTTSNGTAVAGQDFGTSGNSAQRTGTLSWAAGDAAPKTITVGAGLVPVINDTEFEPDETFGITLSSPTGGTQVTAVPTATVTIVDNESHIQFQDPAYSATENGGNVVLTLTRTESTALAQSVHWMTANGTAIAGSDYGTAAVTTPPSGNVTFAAGQATQTISIPILQDSVIEGPETFTVTLSTTNNGAVLGAPTSATVTINDDDRGVAMQDANLNVPEDAGNAVVTVVRTGSSSGAMSVNYATANSSAVAGTHYTAASGTLDWADGDAAPKTISIPIIDNATVNAARVFVVNLSAPSGAALGAPSRTVVSITDNDNTLQFSTAAYSVAEAAPSVSLSVTRTGGAANAASVTWTAVNGSATAGADFGTSGDGTAPTGTLDWAAGDAAAKTIVIPILQDALIEGAETFTVVLSSPSGSGTALGATASATVTVTDDDSGVAFAQPAYTVIEGGPTVSVQVQRFGSTASAIGVTWTTANGTAIAGQDFGTLGNAAQRTGILSWAAGDATPKTITVGAGLVPVINDTAFESDETFTIALSSPTGGAGLGAQSSTTITIADNESTLQFDAPTVNVAENAGTLTLNVTRTGSTALAQNVNWTAANGSAMAGSDYGTMGLATPPSGVLSFAAGQSTKSISIPILNDALIEGPETFTVKLASPTMGATLGANATATVTIDSDDRGVTMGAATQSIAEGAGTLNLQVVRSGSTSGAVSVNYAFTNGTAINGTHYAGTPGTLNWADGDGTPKTIPVTITDDFAVNASRTFTVRLSGASGATLGSPNSTMVTIADDDNTLQFTAATATVTEGTAALMVTVSRVGGTAAPASVTWATADGTALAGTDFGTSGDTTPLTGTLDWAAGTGGAKSISIPIINDTTVEGAKTFTVNLSGPSGATLGAVPTVTVTLNDNDAGLVFSQPTYTVAENGVNAMLTVQRIGPATAAASVHWATANGTATAGQDFGTPGNSAQRSGTLSWAAGDASAKTIAIPILNDGVDEPDETFTVTLSAPSTGMVLGTPSVATVTILDDDIPPESQLSFTQVPPKYLVLENAGNATLSVSRDALPGGGFARAASVNYATSPGTALVGSDYTTKSGTLTWAAGESGVKTISVPIANDAIAEATETFKVTLSGVTPGTSIATPDATVLILDDDEKFPPQGAIPGTWTVPVAATAGWHVSADPGPFEGVYSLRTDQVGDNETAQIQVAGTFVAGTASFRVRVSSEPGFDVLRFYVDGVKVQEWSGITNTAWQAFSAPIAAGVHTLMWSYEKDGSAEFGQDAAWLDAVTLPAFTP